MSDAWSYLPGTGDAWERMYGSVGDAYNRLPGNTGDAWDRLTKFGGIDLYVETLRAVSNPFYGQVGTGVTLLQQILSGIVQPYQMSPEGGASFTPNRLNAVFTQRSVDLELSSLMDVDPLLQRTRQYVPIISTGTTITQDRLAAVAELLDASISGGATALRSALVQKSLLYQPTLTLTTLLDMLTLKAVSEAGPAFVEGGSNVTTEIIEAVSELYDAQVSGGVDALVDILAAITSINSPPVDRGMILDMDLLRSTDELYEIETLQFLEITRTHPRTITMTTSAKNVRRGLLRHRNLRPHK